MSNRDQRLQNSLSSYTRRLADSAAGFADSLPDSLRSIHDLLGELKKRERPLIDVDQLLVQAARYEVVRELGEGGMGRVLEVFDKSRSLSLALKIPFYQDPKSRGEIKQEFRILRSICHPRLAVFDELHGVDAGWFFTMELLSGKSFNQAVGIRSGFVDWERFSQAAEEVADGIAALHARGIVHRDLKSSNVTIGESGAVILDFGLSRMLAPDTTTLSKCAIAGTLKAMPPEEILGVGLATSHDWYGFGAMLFEAATGFPPFVGSDLEIIEQKLTEEPPPVAGLAPEIPESLSDLIDRLLSPIPAVRPEGDEVCQVFGGRRLPVGFTRDTNTFVGRENEIRALNQALDAVADSGNLVVDLKGESGRGKTALLGEFLDRLDSTKYFCLSGSCSGVETIPFPAVSDVCEQLARRIAHGELSQIPAGIEHVASLFPEFSEFASQPSATLSRSTRRQAIHVLIDLVTSLCGQRTLVITVDNSQWCSEDSIDVLKRLVDTPNLSCLLVFCGRSEGRDFPWGDNQRSIRLGALDSASARELAENSGLSGVDEESVRLVAECPLMAHLLGDNDPPGSAVAAIQSKYRLLGRGAQRLVNVAVLDELGLPERVAVELTGKGYLRALRELQFLGFVDIAARASDSELRIHHDLIRDACREVVTASERGKLHCDIAVALEDNGSQEHERLFRHYKAGKWNERAASHAQAAAGESRRRADFDRETRFLREALDLGVHSQADRTNLNRKIAESLESAEAVAEAGEAYLICAETGPLADQDRDRCRAVACLLHAGQIPRGLSVAHQQLRAVNLKPARSHRAALLRMLSNKIVLRMSKFSHRLAKRTPPDLRRRLDVAWALACSLGFCDTLRFACYQTMFFRLALRAGDPVAIAKGAALEATSRALAGEKRPAKIQQLLEIAEKVADTTGIAETAAYRQLGVAWTQFFMGNFQAAVTELHTASAVLLRNAPHDGWARSRTRLFLQGAHFYLGDWELMEQTLPGEIARAVDHGDRSTETLLLTGNQNIVWLAAGDPARAQQSIEYAKERWQIPGVHLQHVFLTVAQARLHLYLGNPRDAVALIDKWLPKFRKAMLLRTQINRLNVGYLRSMALIALARKPDSGVTRSDLKPVAKFTRSLLRSDQPWQIAHARLLQAGLAAVGSSDDTTELFRAAASACEEAGMKRHALLARYQAKNPESGDGAELTRADNLLELSRAVIPLA